MLTSISKKQAGRSHAAEFDLLDSPKNPRISIRAATVSNIPDIYQLIDQHVELEVAPPSVMRLVMGANRNNIIAFMRHGEVVGFYAMLMLTVAGVEALLLGEIDTRDPEARFLAPRLEAPAAIYQWLVVGPGLAAEGVMHVSRFLQHPLYRRANLYSRSITPTGERIATSLGFHRVEGAALPGLHRYVRLANRGPALPQERRVLPQAA